MLKRKKILSLVLLTTILLNLSSPIFALDSCRYCDYGKLYVGEMDYRKKRI